MKPRLSVIIRFVLSCLSYAVFFCLSSPICPPASALDTGATLAQADKLYAIGNYAKTRPLYEKLLSADGIPSSILPDIYFHLGRCYHYADQTDSAIACFQTVSDLYPKSKIRDAARKWLGDCFVIQDQLDSAAVVFRSILQNNSDPAVALQAKFELAATLFKIGNVSASESEFKSFLSKYPSHPLAKQAHFFLKRIQNVQK